MGLASCSREVGERNRHVFLPHRLGLGRGHGFVKFIWWHCGRVGRFPWGNSEFNHWSSSFSPSHRGCSAAQVKSIVVSSEKPPPSDYGPNEGISFVIQFDLVRIVDDVGVGEWVN